MISYHNTPRTSRVRQLRMIVFRFKFRQVVMPECQVSTLSGHRHEHRTFSRILDQFLCPMVNKKVDHFIRACAYCQLVICCSREAQQLLQTIELDTPFDVVFMDFWKPGNIPYQDGYRKILTCLDCMTVFGLGAAIGMK